MSAPLIVNEMADHSRSRGQPMPCSPQTMGTRMIWVKYRRAGIHCWPDAPAATKYLRHPHRHVFHFRVWIEVFHDDREIEFHAFLRWLESQYDKGMLQLDHRSCEMLADELYGVIAKTYGERDVWIEVSEDDENGCFVRYPCFRANNNAEGGQP